MLHCTVYMEPVCGSVYWYDCCVELQAKLKVVAAAAAELKVLLTVLESESELEAEFMAAAAELEVLLKELENESELGAEDEEAGVELEAAPLTLKLVEEAGTDELLDEDIVEEVTEETEAVYGTLDDAEDEMLTEELELTELLGLLELGELEADEEPAETLWVAVAVAAAVET